MIVANKEKSLEKANDIARQIIKFIGEETKNFDCEDDPAEQIYLACHIMGNLLAKTCISLESYGKIYGISNLTYASISEWINVIASENIKLNTNLL